MPAADIVIKGAREHNLRDVGLVLPRNQLICLTGVSGSGKSSLAFDTLYAEGQRRYVESLSTFARQFLGQMPKPDVDQITGLSPSISISQKTSGQNPRSTVGTITEIYDYLRVLYARVGQGHCPRCGEPITAQTREQIIDRILALESGGRYAVLAPLVRGQKGEHRELLADLLKQGFVRARVDGVVVNLSDNLRLDRQMRHTIEVVVDRLAAGTATRPRVAEAVDAALKLGGGNLVVAWEAGTGGPSKPPAPRDAAEADGPPEAPGRGRRGGRAAAAGQPGDLNLSAHYACIPCGLSFEPPSPQLFSFNSPQGMCLECHGLGEVYSFAPDLLVPNGGRSFKQGCIELIGPWKELGRWRRHLFDGVAETLERYWRLEPGTLLETAWEELRPEWREALLYGTGGLHVTYTWKHGHSVHKYGGTYDGIIPALMASYRESRSGPHRKQLEKYMRVMRCPACDGARLNPQARAVRLTTREPRLAAAPSRSLPEVCRLSVADAARFFAALDLDPVRQVIAAEVLKEIRGRLGFLINVGLDYLALDRTAPTLSGGESQRIRLAGQIGCGLVGVLYILDEPSIGLHPRDNDRLLATLTQLRDLGNTVVVVEHDEDTMRAADTIIDFGPGPGVRGGRVVAQGGVAEICAAEESLTGAYLSGRRRIAARAEPRTPPGPVLRVIGAAENNLKGIDVEIPLGVFVCVTGVSGSGKSSLVNDILIEALRRDLMGGEGKPGRHTAIEGLEHLDKMIAIDQSPIGRTPRSNPATYIKLLDDIRRLYAQLPEARVRGYQEGRFSFNVEGGRCEACEGNGSTRLEMDFLADVWVTCPVCEGKRFNRETLQIKFKGRSIADVLEMDVQEALRHFENVPAVAHKLQTLHDVGLDYLKLGQPSPTLSGGEAQRIKLARELVKKSTGRTLYLLDEPTTGLHFHDIGLLLQVLGALVDAGNTVLVVEHNLDVIQTADWLVDLGPEGGEEGGRVVAVGTPRQVAAIDASHTGRALRRRFEAERLRSAAAEGAPRGRGAASRNAAGGASEAAPRRKTPPAAEARAIKVVGARQHNLKDVSVEIPRDRITVCCGPSGSGKSSLAMDTIYAEGQRRYVESLSSYARQFVGQMPKPQVEHIEGLSPAIAIEQKHLGHTPRSTVGTVTEIYDYLRILMARLGQPYCPACQIPVGTQTSDQIVDKLLESPEGTRLYLMAPQHVEAGERYEMLWDEIRQAGYVRVRIDGQTHSLDEPPAIDRRRKHAVEIVLDRVTIQRAHRARLADSVEAALALGRGVLHAAWVDPQRPEPEWRVDVHSQHLACGQCGRSFERLAPHHFSFNSALGWCPSCQGLGTQTGANPAALLHDPKLTLAAGAVALWPDADSPMFQAMLAALERRLGVPADVPFEQLGPRERRLVMHGADDRWVPVPHPDGPAERVWFRFQYKGLYPALDEASRLSPALRGRLEHLVDQIECSACGGSRLRDDAAAFRLRGRTLDELSRQPLGPLLDWFAAWKPSPTERKIAGELVREVVNRLRFLVDVGLDYLTLGRPAPTLSGGEAQRIRLASQVGSGLTGVLYVLDEPTIGLHPRDNRRLIQALGRLRDLGNTLLLVEHDKEVIEGADQLLDFGPAAGAAGGQVVARGTPAEIARQRASVTGPYLAGRKAIAVPTNRRLGTGLAAEHGGNGAARSAGRKARGRAAGADAAAPPHPRPPLAPPGTEWLEVIGARHNNLRNISVTLPLGALTAVTGVSGSGKSSLVEDVLYASLARTLHRARTFPGAHDALRGVERINKVVRVDQQPLGSTPTSNPATYTGLFDLVRELFSHLPEARLRGYSPRRFSFNVPGGRCEKCEGNGQLRIEMHFLPDVWVECDECRGRRYNPETLAVQYKGHTIADVLDMQVSAAAELFAPFPKIRRILETLGDVGLGYLRLGQAAPTLSGGEAQRVKLAAELGRPDTGRTLYLLDEPTTGLHFEDLARLLDVLHRLVDLGNTVVVIEHNLDVIKTADWVIDLGPEAGAGGGCVVAAGPPEAIVEHARRWQAAARPVAEREPVAVGAGRRTRAARAAARSAADAPDDSPLLRSYTGEMLAPVLEAGPHAPRAVFDPRAASAPRPADLELDEVGRVTPMPWESDGRRWHTRDRLGRRGEAIRWDGRILAAVVDRIEQQGEFAPTNWGSRTVVEITGPRKSDGWFFHAITAEPWLLKLKFRVARRTFNRDELAARLDLKPLNEMHDLPVYGSEPRVKVKQLRGPWQEVQLQVHAWAEVDRPAFWEFIDQAVAGFERFTERKERHPEDVMPWKVLGQKWHFSRKGFPPGKKPAWDAETLEELCELLHETAGGGQFLWNNQQVVHLVVPGQSEPWATLHTKRPAAIDLVLVGPKGRFALGAVAELGCEREVHVARPDRDEIRLKFRSREEVSDPALAAFLRQHVESLGSRP